jgi:hypothetical protein
MGDEQVTGAYERDVRRLREAKARYRDELLSIPGVHGIGIGYKHTGDERTDQLALVVHVHRKLPKTDIQAGRVVPERLQFFSQGDKREVTVVTDVREVPPPVPEVRCEPCNVDFGQRVRPVPGGYSVGLSNQPGGTLGGWVWDEANDQMTLISNEHVLGGILGDTVIQPSIGDGGSFPADDLARVVRAGTLDASIASLVDLDDLEAAVECSTPGVYEIADATVGMEVEKVGQTTGLTCGLVELIDYDSGHYGSRADLWIDGDGSNFSEPGDSGALYVERTHPSGSSWKRVIGIHWGGSGDDGVGHPIRAVFSDVDVTTLCTGLVSSLLEGASEREVESKWERPGTRTGPRHRPWPPRSAQKIGLARDLERRFSATETGRRLAELLHDHRVGVVSVLLHGDGRRASRAFLNPIIGDAVTTDDVLGHVVDDADLVNAERLVKAAMRLAPDIEELIGLGVELMANAKGLRIGEVLKGPGEGRGKVPRPEQGASPSGVGP